MTEERTRRIKSCYDCWSETDGPNCKILMKWIENPDGSDDFERAKSGFAPESTPEMCGMEPAPKHTDPDPSLPTCYGNVKHRWKDNGQCDVCEMWACGKVGQERDELKVEIERLKNVYDYDVKRLLDENERLKARIKELEADKAVLYEQLNDM